jgi:hypothetical protein
VDHTAGIKPRLLSRPDRSLVPISTELVILLLKTKCGTQTNKHLLCLMIQNTCSSLLNHTSLQRLGQQNSLTCSTHARIQRSSPAPLSTYFKHDTKVHPRIRFFFFNLHSGGWSPNWVHSARRALTGLLYLPRVIVRMGIWWNEW